jgi:hypothetical protein
MESAFRQKSYRLSILRGGGTDENQTGHLPYTVHSAVSLIYVITNVPISPF